MQGPETGDDHETTARSEERTEPAWPAAGAMPPGWTAAHPHWQQPPTWPGAEAAAHWAGAGRSDRRPERPRRRWSKVAAAFGIAGGTAAGAAALAAAATGGSDAASVTASSSGSSSSGSGSATPMPGPMGAFGPRGHGLGGAGFGSGVLHGQFTVDAPGGGYETLQESNGTVSSVSDTSGDTWSLTVKSADGTELTYVVDSGTSVNGGELGISGVSKGDTVRVVGVVTDGKATAKEVVDQTVLGSNAKGWMPEPPSGATSSGSSSSSAGTAA